jgi:HEAT repeat protein
MLWWTLRKLKSRYPSDRRDAVKILAATRNSRAHAALVTALNDSDWEYWKTVAVGLNEAGWRPQTSVQAAKLAIAQDRILHNYRQAARQGSDAVSPLVQEIEGQAEVARQHSHSRDGEIALSRVGEACEALKTISDPLAVVPLIRSLGSINAMARAASVFALGEIKGNAAVEGLMAMLKDPDLAVRRESAQALGKSKEVKAVDPLLAALGDPAPDVRRMTLQALGTIGDSRAVPAITDSLKDKNESVRQAALAALRTWGDTNAAKSVVKLLWDWSCRKDAAKTLAAIGWEPQNPE